MSGEVDGEEVDDVENGLRIENRRVHQASSKVELESSDSVVELEGKRDEKKARQFALEASCARGTPVNSLLHAALGPSA